MDDLSDQVERVAVSDGLSLLVRWGTGDAVIVSEVMGRNCYRLPDELAPSDIVMDVGAHIGTFSLAACRRGARRVYAYEPYPPSFELARENLAEWPVELRQEAVWVEDGVMPLSDPTPFVNVPGFEDVINTGSPTLIAGGRSRFVRTRSFDSELIRVTNGGRERVKLLKMDCEGAEWPVLFGSRRLHLVDAICGEFHEVDGACRPAWMGAGVGPTAVRPRRHDPSWTRDGLVEVLRRRGFDVEATYHTMGGGQSEGLGLFFACRRGAVR